MGAKGNAFAGSRMSSAPRGVSLSPLASLLGSRPAAALIAGVAVLQLGLVALGLPGWPCPIFQGLGIPCPGCGLSRAALELVSGRWRTALADHAFAPLLLAAMGLIAGASLLPERPRLALAGAVGRLERRTGLSALVLGSLLLYWIARLAFDREALVGLAGRQP